MYLLLAQGGPSSPQSPTDLILTLGINSSRMRLPFRRDNRPSAGRSKVLLPPGYLMEVWSTADRIRMTGTRFKCQIDRMLISLDQDFGNAELPGT